MKNSSDIQCDLLVIGAGIAGMVAAMRASDLGLRTVQVGNSSHLFLASGLLDFLGVYPVESGRVVETPFQDLEQLRKDIEDHPYTKIDNDGILKSFDFVTRILTSAGLEYICDGKKNLNILTSAGTFKPSFLIPKTMVKGASIYEGGKKILLVDFKGLKGYSAALIAQALKKKQMDVDTLTLEVSQLTGDFNVTRLAGLFEDDAFLKMISDQIVSHSRNRNILGIPAVCGIHNSLDIMARLELLTGLECFEIPGLPPSIPGLRLKNAFEKQILKNNVTVFNNIKVNFTAFEEQQFFFETVDEHIRIPIRAKGVLLATGRFPGGGLQAQRELIKETVFDLPVYHPRQRSLWYTQDLFSPAGHPVNQAGILTEKNFRPVDDSGKMVFDALYASGSMLAHNDWPRLKSGAGVACVSAFSAVNHFYALNGAT